jgi:DNA repair protein RecO (recombination protein O)
MSLSEVKSYGFVLRVIRAQEADIIVRLLTKKGEKISAFAKAGLKSRKRFGGALEPLNYIQFYATRKNQNQDLYYLEEAEVKNDFAGLKMSLDHLTTATYMAELTEHCSQEGLEHAEIFNLFGAALKTLEIDKDGISPEGILRQFEIKLLSLLGWLPGFQKCERCGKTSGELTLNPDNGHVTCPDCGAYSILVNDEAQRVLKLCLETSILKGGIDTKSARTVERLATALLKSHWGGGVTRSAQFLTSLRSFQK